jgi:proprotein convertase subtilisin/kexin type 5
LRSASCITVCPVKFYPDTVNHKCEDCHSSCYTCSGPLQTNCLSCNSGSL